jgi:hypothetical protein
MAPSPMNNGYGDAVGDGTAPQPEQYDLANHTAIADEIDDQLPALQVSLLGPNVLSWNAESSPRCPCRLLLINNTIVLG